MQLHMEKIHLQKMLSDVSCSKFSRQVVFWPKKQWEDQALHSKMLIIPRKRFIRAHKNKLDKLLAARCTTNYCLSG
jgi:hypothetical protein